MKKLTLIILIMFPLLLSAQEWAPVGAEWYYDFHLDYSYDIYSHRVYCDSVINFKGIDCKRILINKCACNNHFCTSVYTYDQNDTIYFYNSDIDSFQVLYNFNAKTGDSWNVYTKGYNQEMIDTIVVSVDSAGYTVINDTQLKQLFVSYHVDFDGYIMEDKSAIIQKIGDVKLVIPFIDKRYGSCDVDYLYGLRCYNDNEIGHYSTGLRSSCDSVYIWVRTDKLDYDSDKIIFPNPTSSNAFIKSDYKNLIYLIYNTDGELILSGEDKIIDMTELNTGVYFVQVKTNDKYLFTTKIIKHMP